MERTYLREGTKQSLGSIALECGEARQERHPLLRLWQILGDCTRNGGATSALGVAVGPGKVVWGAPLSGSQSPEPA